jgi:hypothetical protein
MHVPEEAASLQIMSTKSPQAAPPTNNVAGLFSRLAVKPKSSRDKSIAMLNRSKPVAAARMTTTAYEFEETCASPPTTFHKYQINCNSRITPQC